MRVTHCKGGVSHDVGNSALTQIKELVRTTTRRMIIRDKRRQDPGLRRVVAGECLLVRLSATGSCQPHPKAERRASSLYLDTPA
ncbi:hypothetical protein SAMN05216525_12335 [Bradyrhizobium sp. Gha]|nr:hypothetical protein SAMN05216525_12335 [Bradyrhizobium sp. Gha]